MTYNFTENTTSFDGCPQDLTTGKFEILATFFGGLIGVFNLIVIIAVVVGGKKLRKVTFYCICNLAVADMLAGLLLLWNFSLQKNLMDKRTPKSELAQKIFWSTTIWSSMLSQVVIAMDRYCYVTRGLTGNAGHWGNSRRRRWILFGIAMTWLVPLLTLVVPVTVGWNCIQHCYCTLISVGIYSMVCQPIELCSLTNPSFTKGSMLFMGTTLIVLPVLPCILYFKVYMYVTNSTKKLNRSMAARAAVEAVVQVTQIVNPKISESQPLQTSTSPSQQQLNERNVTFTWFSRLPNIFCQSSLSEDKQKFKRRRQNSTNGNGVVNTLAQRRLILKQQNRSEEIKSKLSLTSSTCILSSSMKRRSRDLRLLRTLIIILALFMVSALPMGVLFILTYSETDKKLLTGTKYIITISLLNSLLNPWIYFWRFPEMRSAVSCKYFKRNNTSHTNTNVNSNINKRITNNRQVSKVIKCDKTTIGVGVKSPEQSGTKDSCSSSVGL